MPYLVVIAGPNGAGKSAAVRARRAAEVAKGTPRA